MELNSLMSIAEAGVVLGVILEGTEYVPSVHKRWPVLEKVGFLILVLSLVGDWHFQSAINAQQTQDLIAARNRIIALSPRSWSLTPDVNQKLVAALKPFAGQKVDLVIRVHGDTTEPSFFASGLREIFEDSDWRDPLGKPFSASFAPLVVDDAGVTGVMIETGPHASSQMGNAATALASALNEELPRLPAYAVTGPVASWPNRDDGDTLLITVGLKYPLLQSR